MADYYVKSSATGLADGSSWTDAFTNLLAAAAVAVAGDTIYVSHLHDYLQITATYTFGAAAATVPIKVICVNDTFFPPTTLATTGREYGNNGTNYSIYGGSLYMYGMTFKVGLNGNSNNQVRLQNSQVTTTFKKCAFIFGSSGSTNLLATRATGGTAPGKTIFEDCTFDLGPSNAMSGITLANQTMIRGGTFIAPVIPAATKALFTGGDAGRTYYAEIDGLDMSGCKSDCNLTNPTTTVFVVRFNGCKLPLNWTGQVYLGSLGQGCRISLYNCDSGNTNYRMRISAFEGEIRDEVVNARTGGATDGVTPIAWKMTSSANTSEFAGVLESDAIAFNNTTIGTAKTVTLEVLTDGVTLNDSDIHLVASYSSDTSSPISSFASSQRVSSLIAATAWPTSSVSWDTTGITTPIKQKISVTFTPQQKGPVYIYARVSKPSTTVYIDPKVTVT